MNPSSIYSLLLLIVTSLTLNADVVINEFMADNESGLQDEDGSFSDWIELKNTSATSVNLSGWYLTDKVDDLMKWELPSVSIPASGHLIIFASSKDRAVAGSELHTNFGLSKNGEYLALVQADGSTIEDAYSPTYPEQSPDISYGIAGGTTTEVIIDEEASCTALVPSSDIGTSWQLPGYNDSSWDSGITGVGYDEATTYDALIGLDVEDDMNNTNATVYIRIPFTITNTTNIVSLQLRMKCDDGFIAYINGEEVASRHSPVSPTYNSNSTAQTLDGTAQDFEDFDLLAFTDELVLGENILAIHGLNRSINSSDMLILPELNYGYTDGSQNSTIAFLDSPTPSADNTVERTVESAPVLFSDLRGVYASAFTVTLSSEAPSIYYTLDGSEPTQASTLYSSPISVSSTTTLRARSFEPGLALGEIGTENYIFLSRDVRSFSSNLPIIVVDNLGNGAISDTVSEPANLSFFEPGADDRTSLADDYTLGTRAGIRRRGETSLRDTDNKPNLAIESWADGEDDDSNIAPLGMPAESDWILWGPYSRDLAGLRNAFIYELSNQTGNYAVRTRFVEVFLNVSGSNVTIDDYAGFYIFMEKIKRDNDRVNVEALTSIDNTAPNVNGGYILRIDKSDPGQNRIGNGSIVQQPMYCEYPSPTDITPQQETYITDYVIDFEAQLSNPDPSTGYPSFINVDTFVDHNMFNLLGKNADGLRYSTYMHKTRNGKLSMGPIWDFDRSVDSNGDGRDDNPLGWTALRSDGVESDYINYTLARHWWGLLFENADFWQAWIDRWQELRLDLFSDSHIEDMLNKMAEEVAEARARDIAKWGFPIRTGSNGLDGTQQGEVNYMKWWLAERMDWIDSQLIPAPVLSMESAPISESFQLTLTSPSGDSIYYTLDGTDPRAAGGALSENAMLYGGPIMIIPSTKILARAWTEESWGGDPPEDVNWSGLSKGIYYREDLIISELHYNPREPDASSAFEKDAFEFVEFQNTGTTTLNLTNYIIDGGIEFDFASGTVPSLAPGDYVVVVNDVAAFSSRYNTSGMNIAGAYSGKLSNGGEDIRLEFCNKTLYRIDYNDTRGWPAAADGGGHSLIPETTSVGFNGYDILDYWANWRASYYIDGSPGASDPEPIIDITINEIIAHTDTGNPAPFDSNDVIELYNPTSTNIVLDGDWYLSDDLNNPEKWNIPGGSTIAAGAWLSFDEDDFHPDRSTVGFGLNKAGEQVVLSHRPGSGYDRIVECIQFSGQANGASWGRYPDGSPHFHTTLPTVGTANQLAPIGMQIQEIMYNPADYDGINEDEFLEYILLKNNSGSSITLEDTFENSGTWRIDGGIRYDFAPGVSVNSGEEIWIVPFDPILAPQKKSFFHAYYGLNENTAQLFGPYSGDLSDNGERITLERPQASDSIEFDDVSWIIVDEATWFDEYPWSSDADGTGIPLERNGESGNAAESWTTFSKYEGDNPDYQKLEPGTSTWNSFSRVANLSNVDFADVNTSNSVSASIVAGARDPGGAQISELLNGTGHTTSDDVWGNFRFVSSETTARIQIDMQSIQSVHQINTYAWHSGSSQNQEYALYYSAESTAPNASLLDAADSIELLLAGWVPLGVVDTDYNANTTGQTGVSWSMTSTPINARYLLFDLQRPDTYFGEFDILTGDHFVTNGTAKAWLNEYGLPQTNAAALLDSDNDGQLNWQEYQAGTDPLDPESTFSVNRSDITGSQLNVEWKAIEGKSYTIKFKDDLMDSDWTTLRTGVDGSEPTTRISMPVGGNQGFVRVTVE